MLAAGGDEAGGARAAPLRERRMVPETRQGASHALGVDWDMSGRRTRRPPSLENRGSAWR